MALRKAAGASQRSVEEPDEDVTGSVHFLCPGGPEGACVSSTRAPSAPSRLHDHLRRCAALHGAHAARAGLRGRVRSLEGRRRPPRRGVRSRRAPRRDPRRDRRRALRPQVRGRRRARASRGGELRLRARGRRRDARSRAVRAGALEHRHVGGCPLVGLDHDAEGASRRGARVRVRRRGRGRDPRADVRRRRRRDRDQDLVRGARRRCSWCSECSRCLDARPPASRSRRTGSRERSAIAASWAACG